MSLNGNYDRNNVFAQILRGDIPAAKVFEDDFVLAFMDVFPQSYGHTLVIPKQSGRNLFDTSETDLLHVMKAVKRVATAVNKAFTPDGIAIAQFNGATAGQTVYHFHVHIIPRYADQAANIDKHESTNMADIDELRKLAARIAAQIK